jgi:hypothetical protein
VDAVNVWQLVGTMVGAVLLLAAYMDLAAYRRRGLHRRRTSHAFWMEIDEQSNGMRYGEHGLWGMYVPETVPHRPRRRRE